MKIKIIKAPSSKYAFGGDLQSHGSDFGTELIHIDAGGSHSENPYDGVQMGVDPEGTPNLVEEGETIFNDYVFSNRIFADGGTLEKFHLPRKAKFTFADISKKLEKEIAERPNDVISKAGFKAQMQTLQEQQERQKQEMEAERAKAAFEALSPEEQVAVMDNAARQEAMAEEAAQQEAMQEAAVAQQPTQQDAEMAMIGQEPTGEAVGTVEEEPVMAEGGHLFPWGGLKELFGIKPPYTASNTAGFIPYSRDKRYDEKSVIEMEKDPTFVAWTNYVNDNWDTDEVQSYLRDLDAAAGGNHLFDKEGKILPKAKDYFNHARTGNHKWGYYHLTPNLMDEAQTAANAEKLAALSGVPVETGNTTIANGQRILEVRDGGYYPLDEVTDDFVLEQDIPEQYGNMKIYRRKPKASSETSTEEKEIEPIHKADWLRYAGLFGPAVGLGMQMAGVGRPDTSALDGVLEAYDKAGTRVADWKPIGNYLTYRPMDIWFEQNRLNASNRATDRAILNSNSPSRMAGLLASGYNDQMASGDLYRKALEYNDAKRQQVAEFNRGTDMFNAQAYNQNQQFNANALNHSSQYRAGLAAQVANQKMNADAGWYDSLYGNVSGLFKGLSDLGRENAVFNMLSKNAADGVYGNLGDSYTGTTYTRKKKAKGGKLKKRGLTY